MTNSKDGLKVKGEVIQPVGNRSYFVQCKNGKVTATIESGLYDSKGRRVRKLVQGEKVWVKLSLGDLKKGWIVSFVTKNE